MKNITKKDHWLNKKHMSESLGISVQAFSAWKVEPVAKTGRENFYVVSDVLAYDRERRQRDFDRKSKPVEMTDDERSMEQIKRQESINRTKLVGEQAAAQEMKNEVSRHETAPFTFMTFVMARAANVIAGVMDSMPVECMRQLNLTVPEVEKVKAIVSISSDSIANLGSDEWMETALDEFIEETA
ncbi:MAG: phage terminase Nu1 subunit (DNA packaging protein) [Halioglobus sp.]|jgi:phage terminase Nu1 subunit (DNA packaging protein)